MTKNGYEMECFPLQRLSNNAGWAWLCKCKGKVLGCYMI